MKILLKRKMKNEKEKKGDKQNQIHDKIDGTQS